MTHEVLIVVAVASGVCICSAVFVLRWKKQKRSKSVANKKQNQNEAVSAKKQSQSQKIVQRKKELYNMMQDFIKFYDKYEEYFDKDLEGEQFISSLKANGLICGDNAYVPLGDSRCTIPVNSTDLMRKYFLSNGEMIFNITHKMSEIYKFKAENIENYDEFEQKYLKLQVICKEKGIVLSDEEM